MKQIFYIAVALLFFACSKDDDKNKIPEPAPKPQAFSYEVVATWNQGTDGVWKKTEASIDSLYEQYIHYLSNGERLCSKFKYQFTGRFLTAINHHLWDDEFVTFNENQISFHSREFPENVIIYNRKKLDNGLEEWRNPADPFNYQEVKILDTQRKPPIFYRYAERYYLRGDPIMKDGTSGIAVIDKAGKLVFQRDLSDDVRTHHAAPIRQIEILSGQVVVHYWPAIKATYKREIIDDVTEKWTREPDANFPEVDSYTIVKIEPY